MKYRVKDAQTIGDYTLEDKLECRVRYQYFLIGALGLALIALAVYTTAFHLTEYMNPQLCLSKECIATASRIVQSMNRDIDPCQDFYEFACGGWIKQNPAPGWATLWHQMGKAREQLSRELKKLLEEDNDDSLPESVLKAKTFYKTCLDTDKLEEIGMAPIYGILQKVGLPRRPPVQVSDNFTWEVIAARAHRIIGINVLLHVEVYEDVKNTSRNRIAIDQVNPGFDEELLRKPTWYAYQLGVYHKYIKSVITIADPETDAQSFADDILEFSKKLAAIMTPEKVRHGGSHLFYDMSIEQLQRGSSTAPAQWKKYNWEQHLNVVFENTSVTLDPKLDRINVKDLSYLQKLSVVLNDTKPVIIERFLWWNVFIALAPMTLSVFRELSFEFSNTIYILSPTPRWKICLNDINTGMGSAVSYLYVKRYFDMYSKEKVLEMVEDVREAFAEAVQQVDWMDATTKLKTLKKLKAIRKLVGFPSWLLTDSELNKYYQDVNVIDGKLFDTYMNMNEAAIKKNLEMLREKPDRDEWIKSPTTVNAFYSNSHNSILFPAAILRPPFYGNGIEAVNYGAMGALMGHEITHGFDNQGRKYDEEGNLKQWWSAATLEHFEDEVQCIIDQYNQYSVWQLPNMTVNGFNTKSENIADNGGLRAALRAYRRYVARAPHRARDVLPALPDYEPEQLFFLGFAQVWCDNSTIDTLRTKIMKSTHSPNKVRIIGTLSNSEEFAKAWKCPKGSPMNPEHKCVFW